MLSHDLLAKHETNKTYCWNTHSSKRSRVEEDITEYSSTSKRRIQQQSSSTKRRHCMTIGVVFAAADLPPVHQLNDAELWVLLSRIFPQIETSSSVWHPGAWSSSKPEIKRFNWIWQLHTFTLTPFLCGVIKPLCL